MFHKSKQPYQLSRGKKANNKEMIGSYSFLWPVVGLVKEASRPFPSLDLYLCRYLGLYLDLITYRVYFLTAPPP